MHHNLIFLSCGIHNLLKAYQNQHNTDMLILANPSASHFLRLQPPIFITILFVFMQQGQVHHYALLILCHLNNRDLKLRDSSGDSNDNSMEMSTDYDCLWYYCYSHRCRLAAWGLQYLLYDEVQLTCWNNSEVKYDLEQHLPPFPFPHPK